MRRFILITGASSGIGESAALALVREGYEVIAGVRNEVDAARLRMNNPAKIHPLIMEVTDQVCMDNARKDAERIIGDGNLVAIFNNAGMVINGAVLHIPIEQWRQQFEVNVLGAIRTTQLFFPLLVSRDAKIDHHPRRIINMSSVSGLFASPFLGPYAASKFAMEAFSDSLRRELYMHDIQVVLINAGNIRTPIWHKARTLPSYLGKEYQSILEFKEKLIDKQIAESIPVKAIDDVVIKAVTSRKVKVRYLVMRQAWKFRLMRLLPAKWVDNLIQKRLRNKSGIRPF